MYKRKRSLLNGYETQSDLISCREFRGGAIVHFRGFFLVNKKPASTGKAEQNKIYCEFWSVKFSCDSTTGGSKPKTLI